MDRHPNIIKREADAKHKELMAAKRDVLKVEQDLALAKNRKAYSNVNKLEDKLIFAMSKKRSIEIEIETLTKEAFKSWAPRSLNCQTSTEGTDRNDTSE